MDSIRSKLALTALFSRFVVLVLSAAANALIPDHDAGVFTWTVTPSFESIQEEEAAEVGGESAEVEVADTSGGDNETNPIVASYSDKAIIFLTDGLARWDGQYFLHVANNGYTYENTLAFFPLYPALVRATGEVIYWLQVDYGLIHISSALRLAGVIVSGGCFVGACLALFELSRRVLRDDYLSYRSALLFCWNPASVFFSACYSESLYCLLTFCALLRLERAFTVKTALLFAAATACRANALVNLGFIVYKGMRTAAREIAIHQRLKQLGRADLSETFTNLVGDALIPSLLTGAAAAAPFALFQWYAFTQFCGLTKPKNDFAPEVALYADYHGLKMPSADASPWCTDRLPLAYSYVQSEYWDVGFLRYFQLKQIPNFLLAAPVLYLVVSQCRRFFLEHRFYSLRIGFTYFGMDPAQRVPSYDMYQNRVLPKESFVYVVHAAALSVFCLLFVHVQVSTRMILSSSPFVYWVASLLTAPADRRPFPTLDFNKEDMALKLETKGNLDHWWRSVVTNEKIDSGEAKWIKFYFVSYAVTGVVLFSNFLPWT